MFIGGAPPVTSIAKAGSDPITDYVNFNGGQGITFSHEGGNIDIGAPHYIVQYITSNQTFTGSSFGEVNTLQFERKFYQNWAYQFNLIVGCSGSAGAVAKIVENIGNTAHTYFAFGTRGGVGTQHCDHNGTNSEVDVFVEANMANGFLLIRGTTVPASTVINDESLRYLKLQLKPVNSAQTVTLYAGSWMLATALCD